MGRARKNRRVYIKGFKAELIGVIELTTTGSHFLVCFVIRWFYGDSSNQVFVCVFLML